MKVNVIIEKDKYGYYAFCPELKGCHSQGDSLDDVLENIKEAVQLYLETLSSEERDEYLSREILTTSLEINVA
ncbi:MAG TPA: type II toxin-antitoxin system HicB family antitoxin [Caldithrix sp.]|nr:type II toxin-antitoxin system HicB family antitoxin [Caldithrix sp.]